MHLLGGFPMPFISWVALIFTVFVVLTLGYLALIFMLRRRYTRERFAFAALSAVVTVVVSSIGIFTLEATPIEVFRLFLAWRAGEAYEPSTPSGVTYLGVIMLDGMLCFVVWFLYKG